MVNILTVLRPYALLVSKTIGTLNIDSSCAHTRLLSGFFEIVQKFTYIEK